MTSNLDDLARELATGTISRRTALRRLAAGALGIGLAAAPSALADELERGRCPKRRRCGRKCCPKGARCKNGKCKCKPGLTKCGRKCADLETSVKNCGACGNACDEGRTCVSGDCTECVSAGDCPVPGEECFDRVCSEGFCGSEPSTAGTACGSGGTCDGAGSCIENLCGNGVIDGSEDCDGSDLNGQTCESLGFGGGALACSNTCQFDTSGCSAPELCSDGQTRPCYTGPAGSQGVGICQGGTQACNGGAWGPCLGEITPQVETCNGLDDDCDGIADEDFPDLGEPCECPPGVTGVKVCRADGLGTECLCTG